MYFVRLRFKKAKIVKVKPNKKPKHFYFGFKI